MQLGFKTKQKMQIDETDMLKYLLTFYEWLHDITIKEK